MSMMKASSLRNSSLGLSHSRRESTASADCTTTRFAEVDLNDDGVITSLHPFTTRLKIAMNGRDIPLRNFSLRANFVDGHIFQSFMMSGWITSIGK
jgi:hypothetical protein